MQSATTSLAIARNCHLHTHTFSHVLASVCHLLQRMTFTFLQPSSSLLTSRTPKTLIDGKWCCQPSPNIMNMSHNQPMKRDWLSTILLIFTAIFVDSLSASWLPTVSVSVYICLSIFSTENLSVYLPVCVYLSSTMSVSSFF